MLLKLFIFSCLFSFQNANQINFNINKNRFDYSLCANTEVTFKLDELTLDPSEPEKGKNMRVNMNGFLAHDINDGEIHVIAKFKKITLLRKKMDLCHELAKNNISIQCPILSGDKNFEYEFVIPNEIPSGEYTVDIQLKDKTSMIFCGAINLKI